MLGVEMISSTRLSGPIRSPGGPIVVMPFTDAIVAERAARLLAARAGCKGLLLGIHDSQREGFVSLINRAFAITESASFAYVAQDAFAGRQWLSLAERALQKNNTGLVAFNDGKWAGKLASFGLVKRAWANTLYDGDLFYPGYHSHFGDTEISLIAMSQRAYGYDPDAVLVEVDWDKDKRPVNQADKVLFEQRMRIGFGDLVAIEAVGVAALIAQ